MSKINEILNRIDKLNKLIEEEPKNSSMRKMKIDIQIDELEEEKRHAGFHNDPATVQQCVSKIKMLQSEKSVDYVYKFKSEIESCKKELVNVIMDYYKKGNDIHDIIEMENISQSVYQNWLDLTDFGEKTGYLFVEEIEDGFYKWHYSNPITGIEFDSLTLDELKTKLDKNNEVLFIFNNDLANESYDKDLKIFEKVINTKLDNLKDFECDSISDSFNYLVINADKFNKKQLTSLCEIMVNNPLLNSSASDFNQILEINNDKLDEKFIGDVYKDIIDKILLRFNSFENMGDIFSELREYVDKLSESQINLLCSLIIKNDNVFYFCDDFKYIFNFIENKFDNINLNEFYETIINDNIIFLEKIDSEKEDVSADIMYDLSKFVDYFDKEQFLNLSNTIINNVHIYGFAEWFNEIVDVLKDTFNDINYDDIYRDIIDSRIHGLKDGKVSSRGLIGDLGAISHSFTKDQFKEFYSIVEDKNLGGYFNSNSVSAFLRNKSNLNQPITTKLYQLLIDNKLDELDRLYFGFPEAKQILGVLARYASVFTSEQIDRLCNISIENSQVYQCFICTDYLKHILNINKRKANRALFEEACEKNDIHIIR